MANAGKNVSLTKKRMKWRYGWSSDRVQHDIEFVHSLVSGKKTIYDDGQEVMSTTSMMATDFSHGWYPTSAPSHIFRVEMTIGYETEYTLIIDGIRFTDLPCGPVTAVADKQRVVEDKQNAKTPAPSLSRRQSKEGMRSRASSGAKKIDVRISGGKNDFQSPTGESKGGFDAFADSSDPFASTPGSTATPAAGSADPFGDSSDPFASSADPFESSSKPRTSTGGSRRSSGAHALATPPPSGGQPRGKSQSFSAFDEPAKSPALTSPFDAPSSTMPAADAFASTASPQANFDAFDASPATSSADPFASSSVNRVSDSFDAFKEGEPKRSSAADISQDLMGLSFDSSPPAAAPSEASPELVSETAFESAESKDKVAEAMNHLVSLDIDRKPAYSPQKIPVSAADRKAEFEKKLSLNELMGNSAAPQKPAASTLPADPFNPHGMPTIGTSATPMVFAMPPTPPQMSASETISMLGPTYTSPPGPGYMGAKGTPPQMMGQPYGAGSMGVPMVGAGSGVMSGGLNSGGGAITGMVPGFQYKAVNEPKSSLDTLNWKNPLA
jgi:hypothetical protein